MHFQLFYSRDLRKYNFTNRIIFIWNIVFNYVASAETVSTLTNRFDNFWFDQELMYDYIVDLHGIGNHN